MRRPSVIIDSDIPYINGVMEPWADVRYVKGEEIRSYVMTPGNSADALIIRTRTKCDSEMLRSSDIKFIASATIGSDHVDTAHCREHGIEFINAPGSNSGAVMQYVFTALYAFAKFNKVSLNSKTLGVVGVGNVGSKVADLGRYLGFKVLENDPPREMREGGGDFVSLDELLQESDIVTMHIPLDEGNFQFASEAFFKKIKKGAIFINTSRGEVVDEAALLCNRKNLGGLILDVWSNEPDINLQLLGVTDMATPHIAGYSRQGKINATMAVVRAFGKYYGIKELMQFDLYKGNECAPIAIDLNGDSQEAVCDLLNSIFPITELDMALRSDPHSFEQLRNTYNYRNEFKYI